MTSHSNLLTPATAAATASFSFTSLPLSCLPSDTWATAIGQASTMVMLTTSGGPWGRLASWRRTGSHWKLYSMPMSMTWRRSIGLLRRAREGTFWEGGRWLGVGEVVAVSERRDEGSVVEGTQAAAAVADAAAAVADAAAAVTDAGAAAGAAAAAAAAVAAAAAAAAAVAAATATGGAAVAAAFAAAAASAAAASRACRTVLEVMHWK